MIGDWWGATWSFIANVSYEVAASMVIAAWEGYRTYKAKKNKCPHCGK